MTYKARAFLDDWGWWIVDVDGVGVTQARNPAEARRMAVDLVEGMLDEPDADVDIEFVGILDGEIARIRAKHSEGEKLLSEASADMRIAVSQLLKSGLKKADVAAVLNVSRQRVSQLAGNTPTRRTGKVLTSASAKRAPASRRKTPAKPVNHRA